MSRASHDQFTAGAREYALSFKEFKALQRAATGTADELLMATLPAGPFGAESIWTICSLKEVIVAVTQGS